MSETIAATGSAARRVAEALEAGGIVLIPTDTVYGLIADPENAVAIARIYEIKNRPERHPIAVLAGLGFQLAQVADEVPAIVQRAVEKFVVGGRLTIVLRRRPGHLDGIAAGAPTVGIRFPEHRFTQDVIASFGRPIAATSANISGQSSPAAFDEVDPALFDKVELAVDGGTCPISVHSTVVDFSVDPPKVVRVGAISPAEVSAGLGVTVS